MKRVGFLGGFLVFFIFITSLNLQANSDVDPLILRANRFFQLKAVQQQAASPENPSTPLSDDVIVPPDLPSDPWGPPTDDPIDFDPNFPFPIPSQKSGASETVALEVLYQTFIFYGVTHVVEKKNSRVEFKIIQSKSGYFTHLTKLDVAYAIREFSRYLTALLCNDPSMINFYHAFSQVPPEEIGLRFKYDMAWTLLGNNLPKEPNKIFALGTKWKAFQQIITSTSMLNKEYQQNKDFKSWVSSIADVVNILGRLNKLMCYVDIRPNPQEEIKKRVVIKKLLNLQKHLKEKYEQYKPLIERAEKLGQQSQLSSLKRNIP